MSAEGRVENQKLNQTGFYCAQKRMGDKEKWTCKANLTRGLVLRIMDQIVSKMNEGKVARKYHIINAFQQREGREGVVRPGTKFVGSSQNFSGHLRNSFEDCLRAW